MGMNIFIYRLIEAPVFLLKSETYVSWKNSIVKWKRLKISYSNSPSTSYRATPSKRIAQMGDRTWKHDVRRGVIVFYSVLPPNSLSQRWVLFENSLNRISTCSLYEMKIDAELTETFYFWKFIDTSASLVLRSFSN